MSTIDTQLERALELNAYLRADDLSLSRLVGEIFDKAVRPGYERQPKRAREQCEIVIANLYGAWLTDNNSPAVFYSRDKNEYGSDRGLSYDTLIGRIIPGLTKHGYVDPYNTPQEAWGEAQGSDLESPLRRSRLIATQKLIRCFRSIPRAKIRWVDATNLVRCKGPKEKMLINGEWQDRAPRVKIPKTIGVRRQCEAIEAKLRQINQLLSNALIALFVPDQTLAKVDNRLNFLRKQLYRNFNNVTSHAIALSFNGRFEGGWWTHTPRELRKNFVWIENQFAVELDFGSMEVAVAYAKLGQPLLHDPYVIPGLAQGDAIRQVIKKILLVALNSDSIKEAEGGCRRPLYNLFLEREKATQGNTAPARLDDLQTDDLLPQGCPPVAEILATLYKVHSPILPSSKEEGLRRMFVESQIAEHILSSFADKGIVVLPVHDSFLVKAEHGEELQEGMLDAFECVTGVAAHRVSVDTKFLEPGLSKPEWLGVDTARLFPRFLRHAYPWNVRGDDFTAFFGVCNLQGRDIVRMLEDAQEALSKKSREYNREHLKRSMLVHEVEERVMGPTVLRNFRRDPYKDPVIRAALLALHETEREGGSSRLNSILAAMRPEEANG